MSDTRAIVIGGGYAGVLAANRLTQRCAVTLINPARRSSSASGCISWPRATTTPLRATTACCTPMWSWWSTPRCASTPVRRR